MTTIQSSPSDDDNDVDDFDGIINDYVDTLADEIEPIGDDENALYFADQDDDLIPDNDEFDYDDDQDDHQYTTREYQPDKFGLIEVLRKVLEEKTPQRYEFRLGTSAMIDFETARVAMSIYDKLNTANQNIFQHIGSLSFDKLSSILYVDC